MRYRSGRRAHLTFTVLLATLFAILPAADSVAAESRSTTPPTSDAADPAEQWGRLLSSDRVDAARELCTGWLSSEHLAYRTEAHKCLANVELSAASIVRLEGSESGGALFGGLEGEGVDRAVGHLREAIALSPGDLSIHQGRIHVLLTSGRYAQAIAALEESVEAYDRADAVDAWIAYSDYFFELRRYDDGVEFLKVIERKYPEDHRVVANIGAFLSLAERDDEALAYLKKAVELRPTDPVNNWNLARHYDFIGDAKNAEQFYARAIDLAPTDDEKSQYLCVYALFVLEALDDPPRACQIQTANCPPDQRTACTKSEP